MLPLFPLVGIQNNLPVFIVGVFLLGFAFGWGDICMNNQAVLCEKMTRVPTLGLFHAVYAIGGLSGALIGGALLEQNISVFREVIFFCILMVIPEIVFSCWLFSQQEERLIQQIALLSESNNYQHSRNTSSDHKSQNNSLLITPELANILECSDSMPSQTDWQDFSEEAFVSDYPALICLCALAFLAYLGEGSVADWSAIYFFELLDVSPLVCTLGYVAFELSVAIARLCSDHIVLILGRRKLLQLAGFVAAAGLGLAASAAWIQSTLGSNMALGIAIVGFSISGAGLGVVSPSVISLAGDIRGIGTTDAIGLVSSVGYVGIMAGPPLLGGISALCQGLQFAFFVDAGLMLGISILALLLVQHFGPQKLLRTSQEQLHQPLLHPENAALDDSIIQ
jgi:MFS family permease